MVDSVLQVQKSGCGGLTKVKCRFLVAQRVSAPNTCAVQESTVLINEIHVPVSFNCAIDEFSLQIM